MRVSRTEISNTLVGESLGELTISNATIPLPHPVITGTDVNYGERITERYEIEPTYPHQIHEIKERWTKDRLRRVMRSDKQTKEKISWINEQVAKTQAPVSIYVPLLPNDVVVSNAVKDFFSHLQVKSNVPIVNGLDMQRSNTADTEATLKEDKKKIEDVGSVEIL